MNDGEKWSMASYTGGSQDKTVINPIMLRFRPIAPKPASGESGSGGVQFDNKSLLLCKPRTKRKYVRVRKNNIKTKKRSSSDHLHNEEASKNPEKIVTLQLLPEKSEPNGLINKQNGAVLEQNQDPPFLFNLNFNSRWVDHIGVVEEPDRTVVESWVTVECVTDSCMEGRELGSTDMERMKNLEADTCPGFISDGLNRVRWVNEAYKRMLRVGEGNQGLSSPPEIMVWLVIKQELPRLCSAFSCKVRLQYTLKKDKCSRTLPCDAWKLDGGGGFAWRLDIEAALSLGR
ncbi:uncharacterized protein LOC111292759 [Durio zibethinus]|uniref:Uncharacterized protein LOC111292759 n=1 Tax=Durio zibethinus TaxID=66656 RepID=A0A6P5YLT6_DURZI|nr:uncharacterized protein LOC111292759 [Durio zibethinus]